MSYKYCQMTCHPPIIVAWLPPPNPSQNVRVAPELLWWSESQSCSVATELRYEQAVPLCSEYHGPLKITICWIQFSQDSRMKVRFVRDKICERNPTF